MGDANGVHLFLLLSFLLLAFGQETLSDFNYALGIGLNSFEIVPTVITADSIESLVK